MVAVDLPDPVAANRLVAAVGADPLGQISPSVYETGRLVTSAPWLAGHAERVAFLLAAQGSDGGWGQPDGYGLVPTLSATEALLATRAAEPAVTGAADRGLARLFAWLADPAPDRIPDTPAIELIVPALVESVNRHLDGLAAQPLAGLDRWRGGARLRLPAGLSDAPLAAVRARLAGGAPVPTKLLHSLEVLGPVRAGVVTAADGPVGASPAATAAWLAGGGAAKLAGGGAAKLAGGGAAKLAGGGAAESAGQAAVRYLETVAARYGGPVPSVVPIAPFERAWVLNTLLDAGYRLDVPAALVGALAAPLASGALSGGAGLPPDADTTSVTLRVLARLGTTVDLDPLRGFETGSHFCTWHGERTPSTSTNAHVLEAFGELTRGRRVPGDRAVLGKLSDWLFGQQSAEGHWVDKWHASPYYATLCCALALQRFGTTGRSGRRPLVPVGRAVRRAVEWVLATQRPDGGWGRWRSTVEETAYAVQLLLATRPPIPVAAGDRARPAAERGLAYLAASTGLADPPLWHDKDLYLPTAIVRAAVLAASRLGQRSQVQVNALATR